MQIIKQKINKLVPADYNPRKNLKPGDFEYENSNAQFTSLAMLTQSSGISKLVTSLVAINA